MRIRHERKKNILGMVKSTVEMHREEMRILRV